jgi:hypothetical protein
VDLLQRLLDGIRHFLQVNLAYDIESVLWHVRPGAARLGDSSGF